MRVKTYASSTTTTTLDGVVSANDGSSEGSVTVDTTTPFVRAIGRYPHVGVLTATGDQGTKVEVRAIDDTSVRLSLDSNGDGSCGPGRGRRLGHALVIPVTLITSDAQQPLLPALH